MNSNVLCFTRNLFVSMAGMGDDGTGRMDGRKRTRPPVRSPAYSLATISFTHVRPHSSEKYAESEA